jgi:hypothetical protein
VSCFQLTTDASSHHSGSFAMESLCGLAIMNARIADSSFHAVHVQ